MHSEKLLAPAAPLADGYRTSMKRLIPVLLLVLVGTMIALSISLSKLMVDVGAPILWMVGISQVGAGLVVLLLAYVKRQLRGEIRPLLHYAAGAGFFLAVPTAIGFLSVAHVGPGYISLVFAFPILVTYVLAVVLGMENLALGKVFGVACGLTGGLILALSRAGSGDPGIWILAASLIPLIVACGNIYRTRYWPTGAAPIFLASLTLLASGLALCLAASIVEGADVRLLWHSGELTLLTLANLTVFAVQFIFYFILQRLAGPTYLSQIGSVAAALGITIAYFVFNEAVPENFIIAIFLIVSGAVFFQRGGFRTGH